MQSGAELQCTQWSFAVEAKLANSALQMGQSLLSSITLFCEIQCLSFYMFTRWTNLCHVPFVDWNQWLWWLRRVDWRGTEVNQEKLCYNGVRWTWIRDIRGRHGGMVVKKIWKVLVCLKEMHGSRIYERELWSILKMAVKTAWCVCVCVIVNFAL